MDRIYVRGQQKKILW